MTEKIRVKEEIKVRKNVSIPLDTELEMIKDAEDAYFVQFGSEKLWILKSVCEKVGSELREKPKMQVKYLENGIEKEIFVDRLKHYEDNRIGLIIIRNGLSFEHIMSLDIVTLY